jgi:RimJ/RimL family protein N-acetyltransferase
MKSTPGPEFTEIPSKRLLLRRLSPADAVPMYEYRSDPAVSRFQNWEPSGIEEIHSFIEDLASIGPDTPGRWFQLGIFLRETGQLIGDCGIHVQAADPRQAEIGITLAPPFQGRGLAAEALRALLAYLFEVLGKHRVFGSVDPRNHPSLALMRRIGLRREAHFIQSLWFKGAWADDMIFAMLRQEWSPQA